jgi:hypothetical protein
MDHNWRDSPNEAAAEPTQADYGAEFKKTADRPRRGETDRQFKKGLMAAVNAVTMDVKEKENKVAARPRERGPWRCKFSEITGCTGSHTPWLCKAFGEKTQDERSRIIEDNKLCPFCLLHSANEVCYSRTFKNKLVCPVPECKELHIEWLHHMKCIMGNLPP